MMPEEWPLAAPAADRPVESARTRGSRRLASVRRDFFLDPAYRLTEQERALMIAMLHDLVGTVAGEVLAALPGNGVKPPDAASLALSLSGSGLLDREELVSLLLRRADEHRIATAFAGRAGPRKLPLLPRLVGDSDAAVAAAAMALVVARGRRRDAFGQPRIELNDLPPAEAASLAFAVAAALADDSGADRSDLAAAAGTVAASDMEDASLDHAVDALAGTLEAAGRSDDEMIEAACEDGEASLLASLLAGRAAVLAETAWGYLVGGQDGGLALLARMAALSRPTAARLFAEFGALSGASVEEEIGRFDSLTVAEVTAAHQWWQLPPEFRWASDALGTPRG
jgi:hypothetical protein